ncbi:MAG: HEPN domain-containing protein, partial [Candidatus Bathyarchaeota archaeon]|nr:HEPN domain-containing protein [Candidatus Bathyarchaeota archaeon]
MGKGFYDLAVFHAEQALQLKIKYMLAGTIGI